MPIREFKCPVGHKLTKFMGINDLTEPLCPCCGMKMKRLISQTSFILKGSAWPGKESKND